MSDPNFPRVVRPLSSRVRVLLYCGAQSPVPGLLAPLAEVWAVNDLRDAPRWLARHQFALFVSEIWSRAEEQEFIALQPTGVPTACLWFGTGKPSANLDDSVRLYSGNAGFAGLLQLVSEQHAAGAI